MSTLYTTLSTFDIIKTVIMMKKIDPNSYAYKIGQNIARLRKSQGLTQADMETYDISRAYYGRIELGLYFVTIDKLKKIADAFGVSIVDLFIDENGEEIE